MNSTLNPQLSTSLALHARSLATEITSATDRWMFAPGGVHTITPMAGEGSAEVTLRVDADTAPVLQANLLRINAENAPQRVFFDREHDEAAGATGWPVRFLWSDSPQPGIYCEHEPSSLGKELVQGKVVRAFSPSFYSDAALPRKVSRGQRVTVAAGQRGSPENPARIIGLVYPACGTLTNNPAFKKILPLWAKNAGAPSGLNHNQTKTMKKLTAEEMAALQAKQKTLEQDLIALRAQDQTDATVAEQIAAKEAELAPIPDQIAAAELMARNAVLEQAVLEQRTKDAEAAVKAAVKKGAIPALDEALQAKWQKRCVEDPENLQLLVSLKGSPALDRTVAPQRLVLSGVQITREDTATVLQAYAAEPNPRKRGAIYAREISARITKGEPLFFDRVPLRGVSNTLGTLVGDIISQRTLELVFSLRPMLRAITTDFSDEPAKYNQVIQTRTVGLPTVQNLGGTISNAAETDVPVTLSLLKEAAFQFAATEWGGTNRSLVDEHAESMAIALGNYVVDQLAALWDDTYTEETVKAVAAVDYTTLSSMVRAMNIAGVPDVGRWGVINSYIAEAFRNDEIIMEHFDRNQASGYGHWTNIEGFRDIWEYPALPANSVNVTAMFGSKSACVAAARLLTDPATLNGLGYPGALSVITEPVSGLSVLKNSYVGQNDLSITSRLILLAGVDVGQIACGHKWVSS